MEGEVVSTTSIPGGFKFTLDCDTEQFVLLMWHEVYDECRDAPKINVGAKARATGQVREYEGELQIQPDWGGDVKAIEEATTWPTQRGTGSLTSSDEGQRVMIEGRVIDVQEFDTRITVFVDDGTGEIRVFIWRDVLDRVDNKTALHIPGSRVRVFGKVDVYRGNLEVKPALPVDVTVLETP